MPSHTRNRTNLLEVLLISLVWIVLIAAHFLFGETMNEVSWMSVTRPLETLLPLAVIFLINRFLLVPFIFFRQETPSYLQYILSVTILVIVITICSFLFINPVPMKAQAPPQSHLSLRQKPPPPHSPLSMSSPLTEPRRGYPIPPYMNILIFSILLVGFDTGLKMSVRLARSEKEKTELEKENIETHLTMLKNQVSPHFFMNTLNNIHALIDIDATEAKDAVIRLSNMMRYLIYETKSGQTSLNHELKFIKSYVDLMKLRYTNDVLISLRIPKHIPEKQIPPLLFTSFIENAFKHGVSYKTKSFVVIHIAVDNNRLLLIVRNSITTAEKQGSPSGIGIENTRKRLDLLFGQDYHLDILNDGSEFSIHLSIPL